MISTENGEPLLKLVEKMPVSPLKFKPSVG
jgi:hypothetical protein